METLESMRARVLRWVREGIEQEIVDDAINDALKYLYQKFLAYNVGKYIAEKPVELIDDGDILPFQDEIDCMPFIRYHALSLICQSIYESEAAAGWQSRASDSLSQCLQEVLENTDRPASIEAYNPYNQLGAIPRRP